MNVLSSSHCWGKMLAFAKETKNLGINKFLTNYFLFFLHLIENEQKRQLVGTNCLLSVGESVSPSCKAHKISASLHLPKSGLECLDLKFSAVGFYALGRNFTRQRFSSWAGLPPKVRFGRDGVAVELARKATPSLQNHSSGRSVSLDMTIFLPLYI